MVVAFARSMFSWYSYQLKARPLLANCFSSCLIAGVGDQLAQHGRNWYNEKKGLAKRQEVSWRRTAVLSSFSLMIGTPFMLQVFRAAERLLRPGGIFAACKKGFFVWWLGFGTSPFFISYLTALEICWIDGTPDSSLIKRAIRRKLGHDLPIIAKYSMAYWSIHWIPQFYYLPLHYRMLYGSFAQVIWSAVSSYILHMDRDAAYKAQQQQQAPLVPALLPTDIIPALEGS